MNIFSEPELKTKLSNMTTKERLAYFKNAYNSVFDTAGNITACGRDRCKILMITANAIEPNSAEKFYGDTTSGILNIENVQALYKRTFPNA